MNIVYYRYCEARRVRGGALLLRADTMAGVGLTALFPLGATLVDQSTDGAAILHAYSTPDGCSCWRL